MTEFSEWSKSDELCVLCHEPMDTRICTEYEFIGGVKTRGRVDRETRCRNTRDDCQASR